MEHETDFIRYRATTSQLIDILKQRDLALAVVAAAERHIQLIESDGHGSDAEQALRAALDAYFAHHCRTGERKRPKYDRDTGIDNFYTS